MNWKILFLAVLLLSTIAVTMSVATSGVHVPNVLGRNFRKVADRTLQPMEPIDDESPPG